jgi:hypothetical protein
LLQYCGACHDGPKDDSSGGFNDVGDIDAMIFEKLIVPGSRDESRVYQRMLDRSMPPAVIRPQPTSEEIELVGQFIDDLAP